MPLFAFTPEFDFGAGIPLEGSPEDARLASHLPLIDTHSVRLQQLVKVGSYIRRSNLVEDHSLIAVMERLTDGRS